MAAACNLTFCVVGRDARQLAAARARQNSGYTVLGAEGAGQADYILLPMPMDAEAADSVPQALRAAVNYAEENNLAGVVVCGSLYLAAEARPWLLKEAEK